MAEFAKPRQAPRAPARAHQRRQHHSLGERDWEQALDNTGHRWALEAIGYRGRRHHNDAHLLMKLFLALPQIVNPTPELPTYIRDPYRGIREVRYENRFADHLGPGLLPPPPRAKTPFRAETVGTDDPGVEMGDSGSRQQATGIRRRNGGASDVADDSAETTATNQRGFTKRIRKIAVEKKPDPDALIWEEINASLEPMLDSLDEDHLYLFLSSGSSDFCRISLLSLGNDKRPVKQWNLIRQAAYARRGRWNWPLLRGEPRLDLVEVGLLEKTQNDALKVSSNLNV
ncbi:hypothetical protein CCHR01_03826 [Colletotrichum chrysophilum]|uniref:Uncharacterized protein n=1 Tax=Colletotrichum chrysophilum TaxID=1836956 RepID=A0AAD9AU38_9PEZI|nr:hypothetical protein CCHR01_03826 [Colletotrichum chrysophilum]